MDRKGWGRRYNEALPLKKMAANIMTVEAVTLNNIGVVYQGSGETRIGRSERDNEALPSGGGSEATAGGG